MEKADATTALVAVLKALEPLSDSDRQWVLKAALSRWSLQVSEPGKEKQFAPGVLPGSSSGGDVNAILANKDIRAFMRVKRPTTDIQRVACLAFYIVSTTGRAGFSFQEMAQAHTDSGQPKINLSRALDNATRKARYLSARGQGEKQLTTLGEDVVSALPDQEQVKALGGSVKGRAKGPKKKKAKKGT